jgi:hypothetical protein
VFFGYRSVEVSPGQRAFVTTPAKALLELACLYLGGDRPAYLQKLRLWNLGRFDLDELQRLAERVGKPKLRRAARGGPHSLDHESVGTR